MRPLTKISLFGVRLATCVLAIYWCALFTGTHVPEVPSFGPRITDKELHFSGYFALTILLCWVLQTRTTAAKKFGKVLAITLSYAALDEITQGFVRGRQTDIMDFAADSCGILSAIALYALMRFLMPKIASPIATN